MNNPQTQKIPIQLSQTTGAVCEKCGHHLFTHKVLLRKVSRFITGESLDTAIPVDILVCDSCQAPVKDIFPADIQLILFPDVSNDGQSDNPKEGVVRSL